jgi:hypothetical protein
VIGVACALACTLARANAQVNVTVSSSQITDAYMVWSQSPYTAANFPADGGNNGGGQGWSLIDNTAVFSGNTLTLSPNTNTWAAGNTYWTNPDGTGANTMQASSYAEVDGGLYAGQSVTLTFNVLSDTLAAAALGGGYTAEAFIKDFGPGYSYNGEQTVALTSGVESVTYPLTGNNPGEIVQYGFEVIGPDANPATVSLLGDVVIAPVPEPSTIGLVVCGLLGALAIRRRKA